MMNSLTLDQDLRTLTKQVQWFCHKLREHQFNIGPEETMLSLRAIETINIADEESFKFALRLILCSKKEEQEIFDRLFQQFFDKEKSEYLNISELELTSKLNEHQKDNRESSVVLNDKMLEQTSPYPNDMMKAISKKDDPSIDEDGKDSTKDLATAKLANESQKSDQRDHDQLSHIRVLKSMRSLIGKSENSFQIQIGETKMNEYFMAASLFSNKIKLKKKRQWQASRKGTRIDFRKLMRQNMQTGGHSGQLPRLNRSKKKAKFVLICDTSRSMSGFSEIFLQFAYAMVRTTGDVEVFLFSNKLKRVTRQLLHERNGVTPLLSLSQDEWGTGTRIGESLDMFIKQYGWLLSKKTVVMIGSDGLDTGGIDSLKKSMRRIYHETASVIWFNPLLSIPGYEPSARGMKTALPYIDVFLRAEGPESFQNAGNHMKLRRSH